jgi:predicted dehydrogenase
MNQSIHWIDLLQWLGGEVSEVSGYTARLAHPQIEVEDAGVAIVRFSSGALGVVEGTTAAYPGQPARLEICGDRGSIVLEERNIRLWKLSDSRSDEEERMLALGQGQTATGAANPMAIGSEGHRRQLEEITRSLLAGQSPSVDGREGRKAVALVRAIYDAASTGRSVSL